MAKRRIHEILAWRFFCVARSLADRSKHNR